MSDFDKAKKFFFEKDYLKAFFMYRDMAKQFGLDVFGFNVLLCITKMAESDFKANVKDIQRFYYDVLEGSQWFDRGYYLQNNPDVSSRGINPVKHYLEFGEKEGRKPCDGFNVSAYGKECFSIYSERVNVVVFHTLLPAFDDEYVIVNESSVKQQSFLSTQSDMKREQSFLINWGLEKLKFRNEHLVSIVMPVYGQIDMTMRAVNSVLNTEAGVAFELVIVNNGQEQEGIDRLDEWKKDPRVRVFHNSKNLNFSLGCNFGFSKSIGSRVVFLNNDTSVTDNWLVNLVSPLEDRGIGATQPKLLYPDGGLQCMGIVFSDKSDLGYPIYQGINVSSEIKDQPRYFQAVTAACIAIRASDFSMINGFDVSFVNGQEDVDLCLRLNSIKSSVFRYTPESVVLHYEGKTPGRGRYVVNNRQVFLKRWGGKIKSDDFLNYQSDGVVVKEWILDSEKFKQEGVESYKPKVCLPEGGHSRFLNAALKREFFIPGNKEADDGKGTVLIAAHALGEVLFGGERSFLDMVRAVSEGGWNLVVLLPNLNNQEYVDLIADYASFIYVLNYNFWNPKGLNKVTVKIIESIIQEHTINLVYVNTIMCREPLDAARRAGVPGLMHIRELIDRDEPLRMTIGLNTVDIISEIRKSCDHFIVNSKETARSYSGLKNMDVVYNCVNVSDFDFPNEVSSSSINFMMISSNIPKKGIDDFFKVAVECRRIKNAKFILVGPDNEYVEKLKSDAKKKSIKNIVFYGYAPDPAIAMADADVVLSLSHFSESFGRTVGEAMAAGRPVIAYGHGAIPELIEHGKTGLLAEYKNIQSVVKFVKKLCAGPSLVERMGGEAREKIFAMSSPDIYSKNILRVISAVVEKHQKNKPVTVIVPVYNAYDEVADCLDSLMNTIPVTRFNVIVINDGSTDPRIVGLLEKYNQFNIFHNSENIGYTRTINKAIDMAGGTDVVLLNSDTIATRGWLDGLIEVAYSKDNIGTVTAMSDNAGAFSFPIEKIDNPKPKSMSHNEYAKKILSKTCRLDPVEVTTGSGFCMYIKGSVIKTVGLFDQKLFPKGYGEENEFCLRVIDSGFINVISPKSFVYHVRSASFGEEKHKLMKEGVEKVLKRYPSYMRNVKKTFNSDDMMRLRTVVSEAIGQ